MSRRKRTTSTVAISLVLLIGGCGARTGLLVGLEEGLDTSKDAGVLRDGPADHVLADTGEVGAAHCNSSQPGWSPDCPDVPPVPRTPCPYDFEGIQCEYGDDDNVACNTIIMCTSSSWQLHPIVEPRFCGHGQCPPSFGELANGAPCNTGGLLCPYEEGSCACDVPSGLWVCAPRDRSCPFPRPRLGCPSVPGLIPEAGMTTTLACPMLPCGYIEEDEVSVWQTRMAGNLVCGAP